MDINELNDSEIVSLLKARDSEAWEQIFTKVVNPIIFSKDGIVSAIRRDRNLDPFEIYNMLYEEMIIRKKLELYNGGKLFSWLRSYIFGLVVHYSKKNPWAVSDEDAEGSSSNERMTSSTADDWEVAQKCFTELWRENPMNAYVHLLKVKYDLPSSAISNILGIASENYVDKMGSNARKTMKRLRGKYENH